MRMRCADQRHRVPSTGCQRSGVQSVTCEQCDCVVACPGSVAAVLQAQVVLANVGRKIGTMRGVVFSCCMSAVFRVDATVAPEEVMAAWDSLRARVQDIDGAVVAENQLMQQEASEATNRIVADMVESTQSKAISVVAKQLAKQSVESWKYVGGCVRDYDGCPGGWSARGDGLCSPPEQAVSCADAVLVTMTAEQKESMAVKCKASWPCKACVVNFSGCPKGWQAEGDACTAPAGEFGPCGGKADFSAMSKDARATWSAVCGVRWPCM